MSHLYKRGNIYWLKIHRNGKNHFLSLKTKDEKIANILQGKIDFEEAQGKIPFGDKKISIDRIILEYKNYQKVRNKAHTVLSDHGRMQKFIDATRVKYPYEITAKVYSNYANGMIADGVNGHETMNRLLSNLKTFLNYCVKNEYLDKNPLSFTKHFRVESLPPKFLTKPEIKAVIEASKGETIEPMVITALYTGLRKSELIRLKWGDVDFRIKQITVRLSKSGKFRVVPLHNNLIDVLKEHKKNSEDLCFDTVNMRRIFKRVAKKAGFVEKVDRKEEITIGWHTFRHTFASQLAMSGVDLLTISKLLGHSSIRTTMIYSHLTDHHIQSAVNKFDISE